MKIYYGHAKGKIRNDNTCMKYTLYYGVVEKERFECD